MCPLHPEPPSYLLPHPIPPGCHRALALGALRHTSTLPFLSVLHMVIYMFQCYSLKSSYHLLLPLSPKVFLYICISFAALHVGSLVPSFYQLVLRELGGTGWTRDGNRHHVALSLAESQRKVTKEVR